MRKILVLGGTYFLGRHFLENLGQDVELWVLNRGTVPMETLRFAPGVVVHPVMGDRHDPGTFAGIGQVEFDTVVDFCGYAKGDVKGVLDCLDHSPGRYVFISTVDVLRRGTGKVLAADAPYEDRDFGGETGAYILGKVALEQEVTECCGNRGIPFVILRPSVIYGPYNYAPREGIYFHWVRTAGQVLLPRDGNGWFQPVYVKDVAGSIRQAVSEGKWDNRILQICGPKVTYENFYETLQKACGKEVQAVYSTVADLRARGVELPFPMLAEESEEYAENGRAVQGLVYTDFSTGLKETYEWYIQQK